MEEDSSTDGILPFYLRTALTNEILRPYQAILYPDEALLEGDRPTGGRGVMFRPQCIAEVYERSEDPGM